MKRQRRQLRKADKQKARGFHGRVKHVMSNFRLSLTFRIALHYSWQLLKTTLPVLLLLTVALCGLLAEDMNATVNRIRMESPEESGRFSPTAIRHSEVVSAEMLPTTYIWDNLPMLDFSIADLDGFRLTLRTAHQSGMTVEVCFRLQRYLYVWGVLTITLLLCDMLRVLSFIRNREKLHKTVLEPIRDITELASTLSASNLSNRINIAGTKNELRDLAVVINSMLDRIERSYNSQKQFVSDASHELRTPLAVLQGYISMLKRWGKSDPEVLDEGLNAIAQETQSMKELVESLLFLARHDKKTLMMEMVAFDALDVLTELQREAAMVTPEDTFILSPATNCPMEGDRSMVKQVMRILCDNAVKYTPKGGIIQLGIERKPGWVTLSVADNGPGISQEDLPKIFERFYRADAARRSEGGGHGLGLSIARIIVMAHGGKLRVRSKLGAGSTFYVDLPEKQQSLQSTRTISEDATK
ncbi:MAG: HAMP domain-containing sensor histidine kinase [Clostridiales bacterium]|nr:HAMP domain-containing sensor histidine kinase [Clostridiales bacterium]